MVEQQPQPGPCVALYSPTVLGALAERSLVAWALRLSEGMQKKLGAVRITLGRFARALRAILRLVAFRHRPHVRERAAIVTEIFIDRHFAFPCAILVAATADAGGGYAAVPHPVAQGLLVLGQRHLDVALDVFDRPADDGMMSKSKISVGSHSVAHRSACRPRRRYGPGTARCRGSNTPVHPNSRTFQVFDRVQAGLPVRDMHVKVVLLTRFVDRDAFEDQVVLVVRRHRSGLEHGFLMPYLAMPPLMIPTMRCSQPAISIAPQR